MNNKATLTSLKNNVYILGNIFWVCLDNKGQMINMTLESGVKVTHTLNTPAAHYAKCQLYVDNQKS